MLKAAKSECRVESAGLRALRRARALHLLHAAEPVLPSSAAAWRRGKAAGAYEYAVYLWLLTHELAGIVLAICLLYGHATIAIQLATVAATAQLAGPAIVLDIVLTISAITIAIQLAASLIRALAGTL